MTAEIAIRGFDSADDRTGFDCGEPALNRYIREQASQDVKRRLNKCFVAVRPESQVLGYYTLSASSVSLGDLPSDAVRKLPRYAALPVALIGRLAVDLRVRGQGIGQLLLGNALDRIAHSDLGSFAAIVDAKSDAAADFYEKHGFIKLPMVGRRLFLPIGTVRKVD